MDIFGVLTLVGGLALFLYGMSTMGDALVKLSGGKLESILEKLTEKRIVALLLGLFVTAVIQSSSATTVMVVGLVNSGIMQLNQAVGIIMGANIGTTVTSWILSLAGLSSSNVFIKLLKPSSWSPILAIIGVILIMMAKDGSKKKTVGTIMLGFAVLMFGMETMSSSVAPLKQDEAFTGLLTKFSQPILGMAAGAILTAIIQSSSASVGILQALCITGVVTYGTAIPIIMGQNIGTCVTALISSIGASKNAKRAAFIHLYFNLIGTLLFMIVFYTLNSFLHFEFLTNPASAAGVAVVHSLFNIGSAIVLFPFGNQLVKLATVTVRDKKGTELAPQVDTELAALDERFLDKPSFAIKLCNKAVVKMADYARESVLKSIEILNEYTDDRFNDIVHLEQLCDDYEDAVGTYLVKLSGKDLSNEDSRLMSDLLHSICDLERMSDHAINIAETAQKMQNKGLTFTTQGKAELDSLGIAIRDIINLTIKNFDENDTKSSVKVEPLEEVIDDIVQQMRDRHIERLKTGTCSMEAGVFLGDILTDYERVSDHCSNIAAAQIELQAGDLDMHEYIDVKVKKSDPWFQEEYNRLKNIYILP